MSSFFRSPLDVSSTAGDTSPPEYSTTSHSGVTDDSNLTGKADRSDKDGQSLQTKSRDPHYHANMMLHSLLEEKCFSEALAHFKDQGGRERKYSTDDPDVQAFAKAKYNFLSRNLSSAGIFPSAYQSEAFSSSRLKYREGLEMLSKAQNEIEADQSAQDSLVSELNTLLLSSSRGVKLPLIGAPSRSPSSYFQPGELSSHLLQGNDSIPGLLSSLSHLETAFTLDVANYLQNHTLVQNSRYQRDFTELGVLGKGGYGKVYKVRHRLDQYNYAVKKITLSPLRISKIQKNGKPELDCMLTELRVLARLEHPNIVRYYGGWVEYGESNLPHIKESNTMPRRALLEARNDAEESLSGPNYVLGRVITQSDSKAYDNETNVVFESSKSDRLIDSGEDATSSGQGTSIHSIQSQTPARQRRPSHATVSSTRSKRSTMHGSGLDFEDEDIETVPRPSDDLTNIASSLLPQDPANMVLDISGQNSSIYTSGSSNASEPQLTLHIQMSLHPFTLADFLLPTGAPEIPRHCFHAGVSLRILLAVLDGVEYLHREGVVHRDLKPSNIFLTLGEENYHGCVNLRACGRCPKNSEERKTTYVQARIGDFGLVTSIACPDTVLPTASSKGVGTEFYRPPLHFGLPTEKLDVFSLGVIAFELLYKFGTKMERHETLKYLKMAEFPDNFNSTLGDLATDTHTLIERMLAANEEDRFSCREVRSKLNDMLDFIDKP